MRYEYRVIRADLQQDVQQILDRMSADGWRLVEVCSLPADPNALRLFFERPASAG